MSRKLIFDISDDMNAKLERLADKRGSNKACLSRWAISKLLEEELKEDETETVAKPPKPTNP